VGARVARVRRQIGSSSTALTATFDEMGPLLLALTWLIGLLPR
jgi:hypothetical protein